MKALEKSIICGMIFTTLYNFVNFSVSCENTSKDVLRLHILANSDSDKDQKIKMDVKNVIQNFTSKLLKDVSNKNLAIKILKENIGNIKKVAEKELSFKDISNKKVEINFNETFFKTRDYSRFIMPPGFYDALIIKIGSGQGKNWWCVIFPFLCLGVAQSEKALSTFGSHGRKILKLKKPKYKLKLKILEIYQNIKGILRDIFAK